jgi:predicted nucleotidyltransferase
MKKQINNYDLIFDCIIGSHCYGLNVETSDIDYKKIYIAPKSELIGLPEFYSNQINITKDDVAFEVGRFIELLTYNGNPTCYELLHMYDEMIIKTTDEYKFIVQHKDLFYTKRTIKAFTEYANSQVKKAAGKEKFINWSKSRTIRKTPLDFCFITTLDGKTKTLTSYLTKNKIKQENCGLSKLNNIPNTYNIFVSDKYPYRGIIKENSNSVRTTSIPKGEMPIGIIYYNQNGYEMHCKDWNKYMDFMRNKNQDRYNQNLLHGQNYDSKNIMHLKRLVDMGYELSQGKELQLIRPNREELMKIRRGEVSLKKIIDECENIAIDMINNVQKLDIKPNTDIQAANKLLLTVREMYDSRK